MRASVSVRRGLSPKPLRIAGIVAGLSAFGGAAPCAEAALVTYGFNNVDTPSGIAAGVAAADAVAANLGFSTTRSEGSHSRSQSYNNLPTYAPASPLDGNTHFTVSIAPTDPGSTHLDLTSLTFSISVGAAIANSNGADTGTFVVSYDNDPSDGLTTFVTTGLANDGVITRASGTATTFANQNFDLTGLPFQDLTGVAFRVFYYDAGESSSSGGLRVDNLQINGNVVPEPTTAAALLFAAAPVLTRLRRRR